MSDLVEFLRAQLTEDERAARAMPFERDWTVHLQGSLQQIRAGSLPVASGADVVLPHIARHDPARVLREVEATRQLVDQYERFLRAQQAHDAAVAELNADIEHEERVGQWSGAGDPGVRQRALRREADYLDGMRPVLEGLVKARAAVYAGHPNYREEWRP